MIRETKHLTILSSTIVIILTTLGVVFYQQPTNHDNCHSVIFHKNKNCHTNEKGKLIDHKVHNVRVPIKKYFLTDLILLIILFAAKIYLVSIYDLFCNKL